MLKQNEVIYKHNMHLYIIFGSWDKFWGEQRQSDKIVQTKKVESERQDRGSKKEKESEM